MVADYFSLQNHHRENQVSLRELLKYRGARYTREGAEKARQILDTFHQQQEIKMNEVTELKPNFKEVISRAKREVAEENVKKAVEALKGKLREKDRAETVLSNSNREIQELELKIEQGNL